MKHILIVDNDEMVLKALEMALTKAGYEVSAMTSAANALERYPELPFDLVVVNVMSRDDDTRALIRAVSDRDPKIPTLSIAAPTDMRPEDYTTMAMQSGAGYALCKPFSRKPFLEAVLCLTG